MKKKILTKEEIRESVTLKRRALDPDWIADTSEVIQKSVMMTEAFKKAKTVCVYIAVPREVNTELIIKECHKIGKKVCVPAFCMETGEYRMTEYSEGEELVMGPMRVNQPKNHRWVDSGDIDLVIVPGVAFDRWCGRLGHGGGHYDRILIEWMSSSKDTAGRLKTALSFEFQIVRKVPMGETDVRLDMVVTEKRIITRIKHKEMP